MKTLAVALLFSMTVFQSCKNDDSPNVFGVIDGKMIAADGRTYVCMATSDEIVNSADSMKMGTDLSQIKLDLNVTTGTELFYGEVALTAETVVDLTDGVTIEARNGSDRKVYRVRAVVQTALGAKVTGDMTATGLRKFSAYDMAYFKGKLYCLGAEVGDKMPGTPAFYQLYSSEDGENWTKVATNPKVIGAYGTKLVVLNNTMFAFGGYRYGLDEDGVENSNVSWSGAAEPIKTAWRAMSTTDGTNWTNLVTGEEEAVTIPSGRMFANICVHEGKICMNRGNMFSFGMFQNVSEANLWTTTDGKVWEKVVAEGDAPYRNGGALFSFGGKLWTLGGFQNWIDAGQMKADIWSSADGGMTWVQEVADVAAGAAGDFTPRWGARVAAHDGVLYMVGGCVFNESGVQEFTEGILRSEDGKVWKALDAADQLPNFEGRVNPMLVNGDGSLLWIFGGVKETTGNYGEPVNWHFDTWQKVIK